VDSVWSDNAVTLAAATGVGMIEAWNIL
jgi:hypothetical protein